MEKHKKSILFLLILISSICLSSDISNDEKLQFAIDEMYRMNYQSSFTLFNEIAIDDSNLFFASVGMLMSKRFLMLEESGYSFDSEILIHKVDSISNNWNNRLQKNPTNEDLHLCIGLLLGFKSRLMLIEKKWLKLFTSGYNSVKYFNKTIDSNPENYDAQFCIGMYNFGISVSPMYIKLVTKLFMNDPGTKSENLEMIKHATIKGQYLNYEAMSSLAFIYLYFENLPQESMIYSKLLVEMFPENPFYSFLTCLSLLQENKISEATLSISELKDELQHLNKFIRQEYEYRIIFLDGLLAIKNEEYKNAEKLFLNFINRNILELDHLHAIACLELGKMYDIKGNRKKAKTYYRKTISYKAHFSSEHMAKEYLQNQFRNR